MKILAHRGFHRARAEMNGAAAFARAQGAGYGIETDVRDYRGELVIAHDMADAGAMRLEALLASWKRGTLALNIKADGLAESLRAALERHGVGDYFVFDMSVPEALRYLALGMPVFTRQSEAEPEPAFYAQARGVWLDEFHGDWIDEPTIAAHRNAGKRLCFVSPELHGRDHRARWEFYKGLAARHEGLMLCTDHPDEADAFFHG